MNKKYIQKHIASSAWILIFICCLCLSFSKKTNDKKYTSNSSSAIQLYEQALGVYSQRNYENAIELLQQSIKKDKSFVEAYLQLATIYKELDEFETTEQILDKAKNYLPISKAPQLHYEIAHLYYRCGAYLKAQAAFETIPLHEMNSPSLLSQLQTLRQNLDLALDKLQHPLVFNPRRLPPPLNQFASQYFPVLTVDQNSILFTALVGQPGHYKENIYISHKDHLGNWSTPSSISDQINQPTSNEGTCTISADKKILVFTSCSRKGNYGICDLYISYKKGKDWSKPQNLGTHINSKGWQSQPSLSADGKTLYFVSERKGNYGKNDIWKSTLQADGTWSEATNLGPVINSKARNISPFIHPNGQTLFFASDRTPSMGGFDIYYANFINDHWTEPINLGYPINNHKDQASIFITADGKKGYYADGKRKDFNYQSSYLYECDMPADLVAMPKSDFIRLSVLDAKSKQPIAAQIEVYDMATDSCQQRIEVDDYDGETIIVVNQGRDYLVHIIKNGHLFETKYIDYKNQEKPTVTPEGKVFLQPIELAQSKILENVYFKYNDYTLEKKSYIELNRLVAFLKANPGISIELEGHTDHVGSDKYNQQLSIKRAQTVYAYLVKAGIDSNRLSYKGYGKTQPMAPNNSPENQQLNRRVAFKIIRIDNINRSD
jgi:outer membrane protein OmpA-like peptidoglycan-associated protein